MNSTIELLDILCDWFGDGSKASDTCLGKQYFKLSSHQKVSEYRTGKRTFADDRVIKICEDIWPGDDAQKARWLLRIHADREHNVQVKAVWERLASQVAVVVLALSMGAGALAPIPGEASVQLDDLYIMRNRRRRGESSTEEKPARKGPTRAAKHLADSMQDVA